MVVFVDDCLIWGFSLCPSLLQPARAVPGFVCVLPNRLPVLLLEPKAEVPKAPPLVVPKPASASTAR